MRFWDSSVLIPLVVRERNSDLYLDMLREDDKQMLVWWGSPVECVSAISRKVREQVLGDEAANTAISRLDQLRDVWIEVEPSDMLRDTAKRMLRVHNLRAADALQLSAARVVADASGVGQLPFLTEDDRLKTAAAREGFKVMPDKHDV